MWGIYNKIWVLRCFKWVSISGILAGRVDPGRIRKRKRMRKPWRYNSFVRTRLRLRLRLRIRSPTPISEEPESVVRYPLHPRCYPRIPFLCCVRKRGTPYRPKVRHLLRLAWAQPPRPIACYEVVFLVADAAEVTPAVQLIVVNVIGAVTV
jgi:hypothetical protein